MAGQQVNDGEGDDEEENGVNRQAEHDCDGRDQQGEKYVSDHVATSLV
jgi:hypothetical protein